MAAVDLIIRKREGQALSAEEIAAFVRGVSDGSWPDYQISAMLMAMFIRGLDPQETATLTLAMAESGEQIDLSCIPGIKVDKHSTGGVADTVTLIAAPLVASCGVPVVKISGRGLGFTGGTIDKLESIPGFRVSLEPAEAIELALAHNLVIMAQTENLTPADKKLYALRDVTGTVDSIPLIAASIMSKKIACGADAIVLDVKCGSGAFMDTLDKARELARTMVGIGRSVGRRVTAVISSMDQPLGSHIGNALEVVEAVEVLKGKVRGDLLDVSLVLAGEMLQLAGKAADAGKARQLLVEKITNGAGLGKLRTLIAAQGGDARIIDDYSLLPQAACCKALAAWTDGYVAAIDTAAVGRAFVETGGGRKTKDDPIDYGSGIIMRRRLGDHLMQGEPLADVCGPDAGHVDAALQMLRQAIRIVPEAPAAKPVVLDQIS